MEIITTAILALLISVTALRGVYRIVRRTKTTILQKLSIAFMTFVIAVAYFVDPNETSPKTVVEKTESVVSIEKTSATLTETYKHQQCRLELHKENPYGGDTLVWDTEAFGTYDDGSVWVGYNRKVGNKLFRNLSKICN